MKLSIMQPYVFPYLGYYQLVNFADTFVFFDDVNYIKKGWINKNNILVNNNAYKFTIPVKEVSQNKSINSVELFEYVNWRDKFLKTIALSYKKAPQFEQGYSLVSEILEAPHLTISELAECSIMKISLFLNCNTKFEKSSNIEYKRSAETGQEKVLDICSKFNASVYTNPINGKSLYEKEVFRAKQIELNFINMTEVVYKQFSNEKFVPSLSIIDVLMFNEVAAIQEHLDKFTLE